MTGVGRCRDSISWQGLTSLGIRQETGRESLASSMTRTDVNLVPSAKGLALQAGSLVCFWHPTTTSSDHRSPCLNRGTATSPDWSLVKLCLLLFLDILIRERLARSVVLMVRFAED